MFLMRLVAVCVTCMAGEVGLFEETVSRTTRISYLVQLPREYEARREASWPLLVYLHGGSARGSDIELVKRYGPPLLATKEADFEFILISPQCPEGEIWSDADGLAALIASVRKQYRVDSERIYLTGISMGGRGVLYLAYKYPRMFAAVASLAPYSPIAAWGKGLASTPVLIMHGDRDAAAPATESRELVRGIREAGGLVEFRVLPGRDHFIADLYGKAEIYRWLLRHRRPVGLKPSAV